MDLRKLDIFREVAEHGSFSRAAEQLHMAQPAVSIAVRKLEEELGLTLIDRGGRQACLTAEGAALLPQAIAILQQVAALQQASGELRGLLRGELAIACPSMLATCYLPDLLGGFLSRHPQLRTAVTQAGTDNIGQWLLADQIELGVISTTDAMEQDQLELLPLVNEQIVLCMAHDHPWAGRSAIPIAELHGAPMVVYESGYFIRNRLNQLCAAHGVTPDLRLQSNFLPLLIRMVKRGMGTTIGLAMLAEQEPGLVAVPLEEKSFISMALAKRRNRVISRANQAFWDWATLQL
ncbi:LysR family transcriptional regulator [Kineobactrum sediminis]|uniref:LysR family transcriptional regulator n=1 Tax=Kineobactrum sediminis TaxID=1905677 RepID=A0A2N5Y5N9_9GAMM|nr:LysR family transcriptional regulator [Kineobactrum sediminis]PLW83681.1 LysR family transcriptional regulator [Kineobactrum sediminis]